MSNLSTIRVCSSVEEAIVVNSLLQDGGFLSRLEDLNTATACWPYIVAIGGVRISIPKSQLYRANSYLNEMVQTAEDRLSLKFGSLDQTPLCPSYFHASTMMPFFFGPLTPFFYLFLLAEHFGAFGPPPSTKKTGYR